MKNINFNIEFYIWQLTYILVKILTFGNTKNKGNTLPMVTQFPYNNVLGTYLST